MAKIDYSKSEKLLSEALLKMSMRELLQLADNPDSFINPYDPKSMPSVQARTIILSFMDRDLESIIGVEGPHQKKLGVSRPQLKKIIDKAADIKLEDWKKLREIRERIQSYKKELWDKIPHLSDDEIIQLERKKTKNKRFNVREKWLPLQ